MEGRFGHLLQPIRDLAQNWNVDVASELEDYLHEIVELDFAFDGSKEVFNFAEAALLIQGSACVYSKKVEYLYQLVYETLDLLASKRKLAQKSSLDADGNDNDAQILAEDEQSFLPLDDLPEDTNIALDETKCSSTNNQTITRTPMVLVPLDACEKTNDSVLVSTNGSTFGNKSDFKMNTSIIHESGTLLLGVEDAQFLDNSFQAPSTSGIATSNLMTSALATVNEADEGNPIAENFGALDDDDNDFADAWDNDQDDGESSIVEVRHGNRGTAVDSTSLQAAELQTDTGACDDDPWRPLDAFSASSGSSKSTFRAIRSYRIPSHLTESNTDSTSSKKKSKVSLRSLPLCPITDFCAQAFTGTRSRNLPRGFRSPEYAEFAHMYSAENIRRNAVIKKASVQLKKQQLAINAQTRAISSHPERAALDPLELSAVPLNTSEDDGDDYGVFGDDDNGDFDVDDNEYEVPNDIEFSEVAPVDAGAIENNAEDVPDYMAAHGEAAAVTYEDLVRQHIDAYIAETKKYAIETDLSKRLSEWEDKIKPALVAESQRVAFDIHSYGESFMKKLDTKKDKNKFRPFTKLVTDQNPYEISRMFLATLQLANAGNVQIKSGPTCNMEVKLLTTSTHYSKFDDALAPLVK